MLKITIEGSQGSGKARVSRFLTESSVGFGVFKQATILFIDAEGKTKYKNKYGFWVRYRGQTPDVLIQEKITKQRKATK